MCWPFSSSYLPNVALSAPDGRPTAVTFMWSSVAISDDAREISVGGNPTRFFLDRDRHRLTTDAAPPPDGQAVRALLDADARSNKRQR
jgi:hypothetical protein